MTIIDDHAEHDASEEQEDLDFAAPETRAALTRDLA